MHAIAYGPDLDTPVRIAYHSRGPTVKHMKHIWTEVQPPPQPSDHRTAERKSVSLPARLTWKDQRGATRFATVVARNVSEYGVYVECQSALSIPLYRLVQFQLERDVRESDQLPATLKQGRVLSAVYRVSPPLQTGAPQGFALRLMVDPKHAAAETVTENRATA